VAAVQDLGIDKTLDSFYHSNGVHLALQGELCGPGIGKNFEGLKTRAFYVYRVFQFLDGKFQAMRPEEARRLVVEQLGLHYIPVLRVGKLPPTVKECLAEADGNSAFYGRCREGLVYKSLSTDFTFKAVSNSYLLKEE